MLPIQDLKNKHFNTSAILNVVMTSCKAAMFPDLKFVSVDTKITILCVLQTEIL